MRRTWWRVRDYAAVLAWQAAGIVSRVDPQDLRTPERPVGPPVVLLPGVYESWHFLLPLARLLHRHGVRVHVLPELGINRRPVPAGAALLGRYLAEHDLHDAVLVAHSKGGLIGKLAMLREDPDERISSMIAVNTPFAGSAYARWFVVPAVRAFIPSDPTIVALGAELEVNRRITSVHSRWDPHIPGGSALDGAQDVVLDTPGHFLPLTDPRLHTLLVERIVGR
ncbi:alpha/beta hydrolase [Cellulomonas sp. zg-ZUI188]|uniref:Alpha/beta hydrolase n=1 Tax=Cellulomonas fengjieae TaxID=2819978 RepID=A0ABS3SH14_9CELL|nr:alpha/beta hydrolase [Cellulomonas fengjieae]MBO3103520.1 alpha/beta hydrolase [Cellulomonas fengjieae]QVI67888.1 alpha/beta hydrolase [Cellulomonas fengjieae]